MDFLDFAEGNADALFSGRYYEMLPNFKQGVTNPAPMPFDYEIINPAERRYQNIVGNLITLSGTNIAVKTKTPIQFMPDKHVALQDGHLYLIGAVLDDLSSVPKEAAKVSIIPVGVAQILFLQMVDDPWGIGGLYDAN
jgi:hypothetical protein